MKLLMVASEVAPLAKTGGLADVAGALPHALAELGHDVRVIMPLYRQVDRARFEIRPTARGVTVRLGSKTVEGRVWEGSLAGSRVAAYLVEQPGYFDRDGLYLEGGADYADNLERFSFFSQAALGLLPIDGWQPEVIHCHDWQTALICAHVRAGAAGRAAVPASVKTVLTVHNLAYQGVFPKDQWPLTRLPDSVFAIEGLEFYGQINCLKGGLIYADLLTTVSPTYAREILTEPFGCGLDGVLRSRQADLVGILNGIDTKAWNPATDPHVAAPYSAKHLAGKALCKLALQRRQHLPERHDLLIGMIQRLAEQKGIEILLAGLEELMTLPLQLVMLGTGDPVYQQQLERFASRFPDRLAVNATFDEALAHHIEAGADAFLMPSRFEPCGLNQMYSMRYGTVPIVRRVGGLADTVVDVNASTSSAGTATGFLFDEYSAVGVIDAVKRALAGFRDHGLWAALVQAGMRQDVSWGRSARAYVGAYERVLAAGGRGATAGAGRPPARKRAGRSR